MWGAECWDDYRLVITVLLVHIVPELYKKPKLIWPSFNTAKLRYIKYSEQFAASLNDKLTSNRMQKWVQFRILMRESMWTE